MITIPSLQAHAIYLHRITLTWFKDLNVPEQFGFQHHQALPFRIPTDEDVTLHAWHILPLGLYSRHHDALVHQTLSYLDNDDYSYTSTLNFQLLHEDPEARLVIYMHGTSGTLASGLRPESYRALYALAPNNIHILTFDYRGYGLSTGSPTEQGLIADAAAVFKWATTIANIPPERIVIFGQSMGSAVSIALVNHLATERRPPVSCAGLVITSSFSDLATLTATYRIGGFLPVLSPIGKFPFLFSYFTKHLTSTWLNKDRLASFIRAASSTQTYHITMIHAEDDPDIPASHTHTLFWHAINAATSTGEEMGMTLEEFDVEKEKRQVDIGEGGYFVEWNTKEGGFIRLDMPKFGIHDKVMTYPVASMAVLRAFQSVDDEFGF